MGSPFSSQSILHDVEENHKKQIAAHTLRGEKGAKVGHYFLTLFLVLLNGQSERRTTRSLRKSMHLSLSLFNSSEQIK